jgi:hypothetical protein
MRLSILRDPVFYMELLSRGGGGTESRLAEGLDTNFAPS